MDRSNASSEMAPKVSLWVIKYLFISYIKDRSSRQNSSSELEVTYG